jgi:hypothetical protein
MIGEVIGKSKTYKYYMSFRCSMFFAGIRIITVLNRYKPQSSPTRIGSPVSPEGGKRTSLCNIVDSV